MIEFAQARICCICPNRNSGNFLNFNPSFFIVFRAIWGTEGFTLKFFEQTLTSRLFQKATLNTLVVIIGTLALAVPIGFMLAWIVNRTDVPYKRFLDVVLIMPMFLSALITAFSFTLLFGGVGYVTLLFKNLGINIPTIYGLHGIILVQSLIFTPTVYLFVSSALKSMNPALEDSSRLAGAGVVATVFKVTLPLVKPAILFVMILIAITSIESFSVPLVLGSPSGIYVLTSYLYLLSQRGGDINLRYGGMAALGTFTLLVAIILAFFQRKALSKTFRFTTITGKQQRPKLIALGRLKYIALAICIGYITISTVLPISILFFHSFMRYWSPVLKPIELFTTENYEVLFQNPSYVRSITNTLTLAFGGAALGIIFHVLTAYMIYKIKKPGRKYLDYLASLPNAIPGVVMGLGFLWTYIYVIPPLYGTIVSLLLAYTTRYLPFGVRATSTTLLQISDELEDAAKSMGASWARRFGTIILPLAKYGVIYGWFLLAMNFARELSTALFLYTGSSNLVVTVVLLDMWELGSSTRFAALGIFQTLIGVIFYIAIVRITKGIRLG